MTTTDTIPEGTPLHQAADGRREGKAMTLNAFGDEVARIRRIRGLSQSQLARRLATGSTSIRDIEQGKRLPRSSVLTQLAEALNVRPEILQAAMEATKQARQNLRIVEAQAAPLDVPKPEDERLWFAWLVRVGRSRCALSRFALDRACGFGNGHSRLMERGEVLPQDAALAQLASVLKTPFDLLQQYRDVSRAAKAAQRKPRREQAVQHGT